MRVIGEIRQPGAEHTYGVTFVDEEADFWQVEFPPEPAWQQEQPEVLTLECCGCRGVVDVMEKNSGDGDGDRGASRPEDPDAGEGELLCVRKVRPICGRGDGEPWRCRVEFLR